MLGLFGITLGQLLMVFFMSDVLILSAIIVGTSFGLVWCITVCIPEMPSKYPYKTIKKVPNNYKIYQKSF